jgi:hypothetical protein
MEASGVLREYVVRRQAERYLSLRRSPEDLAAKEQETFRALRDPGTNAFLLVLMEARAKPVQVLEAESLARAHQEAI